MRLKKEQVEGIVLSLNPFIGNECAELRLYGSRVNDELKGGDIDLLLLIEEPNLTNELRGEKHSILAAIKKRLGDQKIDLLITDKSTLNEDCFLKMIAPTSLHLKTWP